MRGIDGSSGSSAARKERQQERHGAPGGLGSPAAMSYRAIASSSTQVVHSGIQVNTNATAVPVTTRYPCLSSSGAGKKKRVREPTTCGRGGGGGHVPAPSVNSGRCCRRQPRAAIWLDF